MSTPARRAIVASPVDEWRSVAAPVHRPPTDGVAPKGSRRCYFCIQLLLAQQARSGIGLPRSALALLVTRVLADDHNVAVTADDLALVADLLDAGLDLHDVIPCVRCLRTLGMPRAVTYSNRYL